MPGKISVVKAFLSPKRVQRDTRGKYAELAAEAWEKAPQRRSVFKGHRVLKDSKMLVVLPNDFAHDLFKPRNELMRVVVFPNPKHSTKFLAVGKRLKPGGPAEDNPGAAGTLACHIYGK